MFRLESKLFHSKKTCIPFQLPLKYFEFFQKVMNCQIIKVLANANKFFTQYPKAIDELRLQIDGKSVPQFFQDAYATVAREQNESTTASQAARETKKTVRELSSRLIRTARALESGINSVLHLQNSSQNPIDFESQGDIITRLEKFSVALTNYQDILQQNSAYQTAVESFGEDFAAFKAAAGSIGATKSASKRELDELKDILNDLQAPISALNALIRKFLMKTNGDLYRVYVAGLSRRRKVNN